jgi:ribosomal protein S18 acetylase RimI-like enzyme
MELSRFINWSLVHERKTFAATTNSRTTPLFRSALRCLYANLEHMHSITDATLEDIGALTDQIAHYYAHDGIPFDASRVSGALMDMMRADRGRAWLLRMDGILAGYAVVVWSYSIEYGGVEAVLDELYLEPEARGTGLGRIVVEHIVREAQNAGAIVMRLETERENTAARAFYKRLGFQTLERQPMKLEW